jgi:hypothetical protein
MSSLPQYAPVYLYLIIVVVALLYNPQYVREEDGRKCKMVSKSYRAINIFMAVIMLAVIYIFCARGDDALAWLVIIAPWVIAALLLLMILLGSLIIKK